MPFGQVGKEPCAVSMDILQTARESAWDANGTRAKTKREPNLKKKKDSLTKVLIKQDLKAPHLYKGATKEHF